MSAVKVTLLFNASTVDASANAARSAGFSESYYQNVPIDSSTLKNDWNLLAIARAALMPQNVRIIGSRFHQVDPVGGSRQYDNVYVGTNSLQNDLPQVALQWTVRSLNTPNQRSLILRGMPDARIVTGEYSPSAAFNAALIGFFNELRRAWSFRAIDRTVLPVKIITITDAGLMTTATPHGLSAGDNVNVMTTNSGDFGHESYTAFVVSAPTPTTANIALRGIRDVIRASTGGRARKAGIIYPLFSITDPEIVTPVAITRKVGAPFRKFRGRRTKKR